MSPFYPSLQSAYPSAMTPAQWRAFIPSDGDEIAIGFDPVASSGSLLWVVRYRSSLPSGGNNPNLNQWDAVSATPFWDAVNGSDSFTPSGAGNWIYFPTAGGTPAITMPITGVVDIRYGAIITGAANSQITRIGLAINGADPVQNTYVNNGTTYAITCSATYRTTLQRGDTVKIGYMSAASSGTAAFDNRFLAIHPIRVDQT